MGEDVGEGWAGLVGLGFEGVLWVSVWIFGGDGECDISCGLLRRKFV